MDIILYAALGLVEGLTEFLPISSTAHLILLSNIFKIEQTDFHKFFEIFIQSGAILAVILSYHKLILSNRKLISKIVVSFIPTLIIGIIFYQLIKNLFFEEEILIVFNLFLVGVIFILIELLIKKGKIKLEKKLEDLNYFQAFLIGCFQALAIMPGISRSGAVIVTMLLLRFKRDEATLYSFFLAVPTIISASFFDLYKTGFRTIVFDNLNLIYLLIGFITSLISAIIIIKWLINYLQKNNLLIFGYYRVILGFILFLFFKKIN